MTGLVILAIFLLIFYMSTVDDSDNFRGWRGPRWRGYHRAYVPGVYNGYIPFYEIYPMVPNGIPRCIDGDSVLPCWDVESGQIIINNA